MRIGILHLSDIHLRATTPDPITLADRVASVTYSIVGIEGWLLVLTGDIAFSGRETEYEVAERFLLQLINRMRGGGAPVLATIALPGNHDCDFSPDDPIRPLVLERLPTADGTPPHPSMLRQCLTPQDAFRRFEARVASPGEVHDTGVLRTTRVNVGTHTITCRAVNTAFCSALNEKPGTLWYPYRLLSPPASPDELLITCFHHPYNWFEPFNARAFRKSVESSSDLVLTGHEHVADAYVRTPLGASGVVYSEGAVLADADSPSAFNVIQVDLDSRLHLIQKVALASGKYAIEPAGEWLPLAHHHSAAGSLDPAPDYLSYLLDPGAAFTHPSKSKLSLTDIFVFPDLTCIQRSDLKRSAPLVHVIPSDKVEEHLLSLDHVLLTGGDKAGKTSIAKYLYQRLLNGRTAPVLISGNALTRTSSDHLVEVVNRALDEQYARGARDAYWQLPRTERMLIVDDLDVCRLSRADQGELLKVAKTTWQKILLLGSDTLRLEELTHDGDASREFLSFETLEIRDLGYHLRERLIEKWFSVGAVPDLERRDTALQIKEADKLVTTLLGQSLLPAYPIFILIMLQQYEAFAASRVASGSYAYYYQALIHSALANRTGSLTVDTVNTFSSALAYWLMTEERRDLTLLQFDGLVAEYRAQYRMDVHAAEVLKILEDAEVLERTTGDGGLRFKYPYAFYYFSAKYIADNLSSEAEGLAVRARVTAMTQALHVTDNANVVVFLVYLTRDEDTIRRIVSHARSLLKTEPAFDLATDVAFANSLMGIAVPIMLEDGKAKDHRAEFKKKLDESGDTGWREAKESERRELDETLQVNNALKTVQIMGQVLRSSPGSLRGDLKLVVARECVGLGLRVATRIFRLAQSQADELKEFLKELLREYHGLTTERELSWQSEKLLFSLLLGAGYGVIRRISEAVGSAHLRETYRDLSNADPGLSLRMLDASIKMDHFQDFPYEEVSTLHRLMKKNGFALTLLRRLVRDHFYIFPVDYRTRQRVCTELDIAVGGGKLLAGARELLPRAAAKKKVSGHKKRRKRARRRRG